MAETLEVMQPMELFEGMWPVDRTLEANAKEYLHTGKIVCKDAARVERICRAVLLRIPAREIARREHVGRESIDAIMQDAHASGKLRPIAETLLADATEIAMLAAHELKDALANGLVQKQCLGMVWGTAVDKIAALTHSAGGAEAPKDTDDSEARIRSYWEVYDRARAAACASQASANDAQALELQSAKALPALPATGSATGNLTLDLPTEPVAPVARVAAVAPAAAEGGGGVTPTAPAPDGRGVRPENLEP